MESSRNSKRVIGKRALEIRYRNAFGDPVSAAHADKRAKILTTNDRELFASVAIGPGEYIWVVQFCLFHSF
jgi:hypothetical protein